MQVVGCATEALKIVADKCGHTFNFTEHKFGGCSIDAYGDPLTDATLE